LRHVKVEGEVGASKLPTCYPVFLSIHTNSPIDYSAHEKKEKIKKKEKAMKDRKWFCYCCLLYSDGNG